MITTLVPLPMEYCSVEDCRQEARYELVDKKHEQLGLYCWKHGHAQEVRLLKES